MLNKDELPACPVATVVEIIGNKWKLLILRNILTKTSRFGELKKDLPGISQKVLTDNLRALEADGIIVRTAYAEVPPKVEYSISDIGDSLRPLFKSMEDWGNTYKDLVDLDG